MLGWKIVEREIEPGVSLERAREILKEAGFEENVINPGYVIFKQPGTVLTTKGENYPLEAALAGTESGLLLQLRYDVFVLFDTGDLERFADELADKLSA